MKIAKKPSAEQVDNLEGWPEPGPIAPVPVSKPYPVEFFPETAREAINEFHAFGKQPLPMIASAALAQMAIAAQGLADVGRDEILVSPTSLNVLIVGQSGERKTAIDRAFSQAAREWEKKEQELRNEEYRRGKAMMQSRQSRIEGVKQKIKSLAGKEKEEAKEDLCRLEERLVELETNDIHVPPLPHLFFEDVTQEGLAYHIATGWPSAALVSDEAGLVVGGKGASEENALGFLTLLNRLWDGREFRPVRKTAQTAEIKGRRFSASLMLQRELIENIAQKGGRGVGFFGRYLIAAPPSTMGKRLYSVPPPSMPALARFNQRIHDLLDTDLQVNEEHEISPLVMIADYEAQELWRKYHDDVEIEMGEYGKFAPIRDVAAKSAENAARIACVFQVFDRGPGGPLLAKYMESGITVAVWHLHEANRLFFETDKPEETKDAELLADWLLNEAPKLKDASGNNYFTSDGRFPLREVSRLGPYRLRGDRARRDQAILILADEEVGYLRLLSDGRKKWLKMNPKLFR